MIDETLALLYQVSERPRPVTVGSTALTSGSDTSLTLASGDEDYVQVTSVLEGGQELLLVTGKSTDATPVFTVSRGYAGSTAAATGHATSDTLQLDPAHPRHEIDRAIRRCLKGPFNVYLPNITNGAFTRVTDRQYFEMPATTMFVNSVRFFSSTTGKVIDVAGWQFEQDLPTSVSSTTKLLRLPSNVGNSDSMIVVYQTPYSFTGSGDESDTISVPVGAEDLPSLWAAAYLAFGREISRIELDRVEEAHQDQQMRGGGNIRQIREMWAQFYRLVDEVRRNHHVPRHRPYRKMARI